MKYWLATHRVDLHKKHGDLIGCRTKKNGDNMLEACSVNFKKMNKGDLVVVCSRSSDKVFGVYQIKSDGFSLIDDPEWGTAYCYKLDLEIGREPAPSFKKFKDEFSEKLNFMNDNNGWEGSSVGWIKEITESDQNLFLKYLKTPV